MDEESCDRIGGTNKQVGASVTVKACMWCLWEEGRKEGGVWSECLHGRPSAPFRSFLTFVGACGCLCVGVSHCCSRAFKVIGDSNPPTLPLSHQIAWLN